MSAGDWVGVGMVLGLLVAMLAAIAALTWTWREFVALLREWINGR